MVDPGLLRQTFESVLGSMTDAPLGRAILHGDVGRPLAIILVVDDPDLASKFAAMLPLIYQRLGVVCDADEPTA